ncbi:MAG: serine hydroxymethyltransferase [Dehalococcoidia bacterium]|jgi:glycine hydroxymethyltransferase|nr:MAG: glycine hydroxymethyltransferase [Chloroflexota bacterium]|tara:strand:- start:1232 stop:2488 length:1257 start_codon:yes stop_codon:yes gene_type:complete
MDLVNGLSVVDPEVFQAIIDEEDRQVNMLEMIASENYTSSAVIDAVGSVLTNKYAEGYPNARYYGGCEHVDIVEQLAIDRAKKLFGADHANVQPHSGSQANLAAYSALMKVGDKALGLALDQGGHLTHGHAVNMTGKLYNFAHYGVNRDDEYINYEEMEKIAQEHRPKVIVIGTTAYPRNLDFAKAKKIADEVGAFLLADVAHISGLIAANVHPSPVGIADVITMSTHKTLRGPRGGMILCNETIAKKIDKAVFPGSQGGPLMHVIAGKAVALKEAMTDNFTELQKKTVSNAKTLAKTLNDGGLRLVSGGTDNHLILVDVTPLGINGKSAEDILSSVGIIVNKNAIPYDSLPPSISSGIRIGTPALTSRGFGEKEMETVGGIIVDLFKSDANSELKKKAKKIILELCTTYPAPGIKIR